VLEVRGGDLEGPAGASGWNFASGQAQSPLSG